MKPVLFILLTFLLLPMSLFADSDGLKIFKNSLMRDPDFQFHNGIEFAKVGRGQDELPNIQVEKGGVNLFSLVSNTGGLLVDAYSLYDSDYAFDNYNITIKFKSPNGAKHKIVCHVLDVYNCGKMEIVNCSKSEYGYTYKYSSPSEAIYFPYDYGKYLRCQSKNRKIANSPRSSSQKEVRGTNSSSGDPEVNLSITSNQ